MDKRTRDDEIIRDILTRVDEAEHLNQRTLAKELGIALGMANAYLKRCVRKGYIKVSQIPPNRYAYYLTPQGFSEKTRLTAEFLTDSFSFFRRARTQYADIYRDCERHGWRNVAIAGTSELADIAVLYAGEFDIELTGVIEPAMQGEQFHSLQIVAEPTDLNAFDAVVLAQIQAPQSVYDALLTVVPAARVLVPPLLPVTLADASVGGGAVNAADEGAAL